MPNQNSETTTDQRLIDLEIKATFTEDLMEQLDAVIVRQQTQIDVLIAEVRHLRESQKNASASMSEVSVSNLRSDLPPHF